MFYFHHKMLWLVNKKMEWLSNNVFNKYLYDIFIWKD